MSVVSLRIQPEIWERCAWAAVAKGMNRNEYVRTTLADATRDAKPPKDRNHRGFTAPSEEWAAFEQVARLRGERVDDTLRVLMKRAVEMYENKLRTAA